MLSSRLSGPSSLVVTTDYLPCAASAPKQQHRSGHDREAEHEGPERAPIDPMMQVAAHYRAKRERRHEQERRRELARSRPSGQREHGDRDDLPDKEAHR